MIVILVCGKFHYPKYFPKFKIKNHRLFFSHHIETLRDCKNAHNLYAKEYFLKFGLNFLPGSLESGVFYFSHFLWRFLLFFKKEISTAEIVHYLCHGNNTFLIKRAKGIKIAEVVNAHPVEQKRLLEISAAQIPARYGICKLRNAYFSKADKMIEDEAMLADYLLAPSEFVKNSYIKNGFDATRIKVIPYGMDRKVSPETTVISTKSDSINVLCVGQVIPRKGQHVLVDAVKKMRSVDMHVNLTLVGARDEKYFCFLKDLFSDFTYISHVPSQDMLNFMRKFDCLVVPSFEDGFAVVVSEAMSATVPTIVSSTTGGKDLMRHQRYSVFETGCVESLISKLKSVMDGEYFEQFQYSYDWSGYAQRLDQFYIDAKRNSCSN